MIEPHGVSPGKSFDPECQDEGLAELAPLAEGLAPARDTQGRFKTGNIGGGRPKGARNRLTDVFLSAVVNDFCANGAETIARVRKEDPATYLKMICAIIPRDLIMQREREPYGDIENLSFSELGELIDGIKRRQRLLNIVRSAERT